MITMMLEFYQNDDNDEKVFILSLLCHHFFIKWVYECVCIECLKMYESGWKCMKVDGNVWKCMKVYGRVWEYTLIAHVNIFSSYTFVHSHTLSSDSFIIHFHTLSYTPILKCTHELSFIILFDFVRRSYEVIGWKPTRLFISGKIITKPGPHMSDVRR